MGLGGVTESVDLAQEQEQLIQLIRVRRIATGLLILMAVVFAASRVLEPSYPYLAFVTAFAEAAMVGALADWFAVTALFRRPLKLPIPHTAIIPNNKDRIGASVANFLEHNFMTPEVLREELVPINFTGVAADWLSVESNRKKVSCQVVKGIPAIFRLMEDDQIGKFVQHALAGTLQSFKAAPMLAEVLAVLVANGRHQQLFDHFIEMTGNALQQNRPYIRQKVHENSPRWLPRVIDDKLFERLLTAAQTTLDEMRDPHNEWRKRFQTAAEDLIQNLKTSPEYEEKLSKLVNQALHHPLFQDYSQQIWTEIKQKLIADAESENSYVAAQLDNTMRAFANTLRQDTAVQQKLDVWIRELAVETIVKRRRDIAGLVENVIQKWDADTVSKKFEIYVGKDLQYIRINGTLVGGMVGLVLHTISHYL